eukprot:3336976-Rhodomonas_salina.1
MGLHSLLVAAPRGRHAWEQQRSPDVQLSMFCGDAQVFHLTLPPLPQPPPLTAANPQQESPQVRTLPRALSLPAACVARAGIMIGSGAGAGEPRERRRTLRPHPPPPSLPTLNLPGLLLACGCASSWASSRASRRAEALTAPAACGCRRTCASHPLCCTLRRRLRLTAPDAEVGGEACTASSCALLQ